MSPALDAAAIAARFGLGRRPVSTDHPHGANWARCGRCTPTGAAGRSSAATILDVAKIETTKAVQDAAIAHGVLSPASIRAVDGALDVEQLGTTLARLHTAGATAGRLDPWFTQPITAAQWDAILAATAHAPFAAELAAHRDDLVAVAGEVVAPETLRACHRDLFADNVRTAGDDGLVVFDWDSAGAADPRHELAMVLWEYCRADPTRAPRLYAAYRAAGGPGRIEGPGSFSMMICISSRLLHRSARIWLDAGSGPAERAFREPDVADWIRDPCTRPVIDALLAAVAG